MTNAIFRGKPDAGNPHIRFDEGEVASAKPRRGSLLYKNIISLFAAVLLAELSAFAAGKPDVVIETRGVVETDVVRFGEKIFGNRSYKMPMMPKELDGLGFARTPIDGFRVECVTAGRLYALTPAVPHPKDPAVGEELMKRGFARVADIQTFQLFGTNSWERVNVFYKDVTPGESFDIAKWAVLVGVGKATRVDPLTPPYIRHPPKAIDIDGGRQLFVDDYLVESTNGVVRHWNAPTKIEDPIIRPTSDVGTRAGGCAVATDGGLWWDPTIGKFRLWYENNWAGNLCYAESSDGLIWERPDLGKVKGTNRVFSDAEEKCDKDLDSWSVWPNYKAANPYADWKLFVSKPGAQTKDMLSVSSDGRNFTELGQVGWSNDRSTLHFDAILNRWVYSLRAGRHCGRARDFLAVDELSVGGPLYWVDSPWLKNATKPEGAIDPEHWTNLDGEGDHQLYNFDAVPYESLMLGVREILHVDKSADGKKRDNEYCWMKGLPKSTALQFCFSRDGKHYSRAPGDSIAPSGWGSGKWDTGYLSAMGGICVIKDERLWFYYSGLRGDATLAAGGVPMYKQGMYYNGAIGAATLRRDGFCGMVADGVGELVTRPLAFTGGHLFVNAECLFGEVAAEVIDAEGRAIAGFAAADCQGLRYVDRTKAELVFAGGTLDALKGRCVRLRFKLHCATLYSFWISPSARGESHGYVAAGGPAYKGLRDL